MNSCIQMLCFHFVAHNELSCSFCILARKAGEGRVSSHASAHLCHKQHTQQHNTAYHLRPEYFSAAELWPQKIVPYFRRAATRPSKINGFKQRPHVSSLFPCPSLVSPAQRGYVAASPRPCHPRLAAPLVAAASSPPHTTTLGRCSLYVARRYRNRPLC